MPTGGRRLPWLAAMRPEVVVRKSSFLWRQTDDVRSRTPSGEASERLRFSFAGTMYCGSALTKPVHTTFTTYACSWICVGRSDSGRDICIVVTIESRSHMKVCAKDFSHDETVPGLADTRPHFFVVAVNQERGTMPYRCVASSPEGLVQQVAVCYLRHGYWWYVTGWIPKGKDPEAVDRKLIEKYEINQTDRQRAYRKQRGLANMQYIRYANFFLLMVTDGHHSFKQQERSRIQDCRRNPIKFEGYSISYRRAGITPKGGGDPKWHACVRIDPWTYRELKAYFLNRATHRSAAGLAEDFARVPFARFAPVRRQLLTIHRAVNQARSSQGYESLPHSVLRLRRQIVQPFVDQEPIDSLDRSMESPAENSWISGKV